MKSIFKIVFITLSFFCILLSSIHAETKNNDVYPTAILPFQERGDEVLGLGSKISDLLMVPLMMNSNLYLIDREDLNKSLEEAEINLSGMVSQGEAIQVGKLSGARIFVTGSVMSVGSKNIIVAKVIGTETSRVFGASVKGTSDKELDVLVDELGEKINSIISTKGNKLVAAKQTSEDAAEEIIKNIGSKKRPKVYISIIERHIGRSVIDPAAETEFIRICKKAGFEVLKKPKTKDQNADFIIKGEGFSEFATRKQGITSCKARLEIKIIDPSSEKVVDADRQVAIAVDLSEHIAGKTALQKAAVDLAKRMLPQICE